MGVTPSKIALSAVLVFTLLSGCTDKLRDKFDPEKNDHIDPALELSRDDYRKMGKPIMQGEKKVEAKVLPPPPPPLPNLQQLLSIPKPPKIEEEQLVSIAVTDDVPLKDVLLELSRLAEVDIELDAGIQGGVSFVAREKPFNTVIERLASLAGLRYSMKSGVLRVERDTPYIQSYPIDFLNISRSASSDISISTNVLSASGGGDGGGGLNTGSTQSINSTTEGDFWESLNSGLEQILASRPIPMLAQINTFSMQGDQALINGGDRMDPRSRSNMGGSGPESGENQENSFYVLNRQAGMLTVSGTERQHELVQRFIEQVRINSSAQVLIEAKIVEISLSDQYQSGVEWSTLSNKLGMATDFNSVDPTGGAFTLSLPNRLIGGLTGDTDGSGADLNDFIQLVQEFGTTRTLSSPRLHAINNQQAVLTFAENLVYFEINVERETDTSAATTQEVFNVESEVKTVPIGIILTLQPSVNVDTGEITLSVRPTLSRVTNFVTDPAVAFLAAEGGQNIENRIPVVEVRELDSILKVKSGQVMIIGGLMEDTATSTDRGVPGISEVPWFGNLFKSVNRDQSKRELVIFIRATLVGNDGYIQEADRNIVDSFTDDTRPLKFDH